MAPGTPWPVRLCERVAADTGLDVELDDRPFTPYGGRAVEAVARAVESSRPDVVLFTLGTYLFSVGFVGAKIRRRFGDSAFKRYRRAETWLQGSPENPTAEPNDDKEGPYADITSQGKHQDYATWTYQVPEVMLAPVLREALLAGETAEPGGLSTPR